MFLFCDVRDAALAHVRALQVPEAGGNRFFVVGGMFSNWRIWELVREKMGGKTIRPRNGERERKMEEDDMPDDVYGFNSDKSKEVLGIEYHDLRMCIGDTVSAMIKYENLGNEGCGD